MRLSKIAHIALPVVGAEPSTVSKFEKWRTKEWNTASKWAREKVKWVLTGA